MKEPDKRNVPGDFYVQRDCCTLCGVPWHIAPNLFKYDDFGCWVSHQPAERAEEDRMIEVMATQELGCIHYRGSDNRIIDALKGFGWETERDAIVQEPESSTEGERQGDRPADGLVSRLFSRLKVKL
jgi:hypothetical protein